MPVPVLPLAVGASSFLDWLNKNSANSDATSALMDSLKNAQGAIQGSADKAMGYQQPYLQNAGQDFQRQRGLVQSGYYQTPYGKSFQGQSYTPSGFSFNPSQGAASFSPWQSSGPASFTPQGLPPMPQMAPYQPPPQYPPTARPPSQQPPTIPIQQLLQTLLQNNPQPGSMQKPAGPSPQNQGLMNYNPQTGQGSPNAQYTSTSPTLAPGNPTQPTLQDLMNLMLKNPQFRGRSGPLEGGMPTGGLLGGR